MRHLFLKETKEVSCSVNDREGVKILGVNELRVEGKEESGASGNTQGAVLVVLRGVERHQIRHPKSGSAGPLQGLPRGRFAGVIPSWHRPPAQSSQVGARWRPLPN
jgi:hypothetical protein